MYRLKKLLPHDYLEECWRNGKITPLQMALADEKYNSRFNLWLNEKNIHLPSEKDAEVFYNDILRENKHNDKAKQIWLKFNKGEELSHDECWMLYMNNWINADELCHNDPHISSSYKTWIENKGLCFDSTKEIDGEIFLNELNMKNIA